MDRIPMFRQGILKEQSLAAKATWTIAAVAVPTTVRWVVDQGASGIPFVTYFPAILLVAVFLGWESAAVTAVASAVIANRLLRQEPLQFNVNGTDALVISLFLVACVIVIAVGQTLRRVIKAQEAARQREEELKRELLHRSKNTLVVVQSLASLTARHSDPKNFMDDFGRRLEALGKANDLLGVTPEESGDAVDLANVIEAAIEPFKDDDSVVLRGEGLGLSRLAVVPLSLALHELCTNAAKYGSLSRHGGRVSIEWRAISGSQIRLRWQEAGGPKVVQPTRKGMGSLLLRPQRGIKDVQHHFHEHGVECIMVLYSSYGQT